MYRLRGAACDWSRRKDNATIARDVEALDKVVEEYKGSAFFDMDAAIACRSTFMAVYIWIEQDMQKYFYDFDLAHFQCMKIFLKMRRQKREMDSASETESSEVSLPPSPKGTPTGDDGQLLLPETERLSTPLPPNDDATP